MKAQIIGLVALAATAAVAEPVTNGTAKAAGPAPKSDELSLDGAGASDSVKLSVQNPGDGSALIDIDCDDATLSDVLRQFRHAVGANIISGASSNLLQRVSVSLRQVPWFESLQSILNTRNFRLEPRGGIYFVSEERTMIPTFTRTYTLNHASAEELAAMFNKNYGKKAADGKIVGNVASSFPGANVIVVTADEKTLSECEAIIKAVDKAVAQIYIEARFLELSSEAMHKLGMQWDQLRSWGVSAKGLVGGYEANSGKMADYGTYLSNRNNSNESSASSERSNSESGSASASSSSSSSKSSSSLADTLKGIGPEQLEGAPGAGRQMADMAWRNAAGFSGQLSADDFRLALSAFESFGEGKIFSNPKIIVSNGKEAKVDMTTKEPNVSISSDRTGEAGQFLNISTKLEVIPGEDKQMFAKEAFFSYGIELSVKPRISPDGLISVEIVPTISEKTGTKDVVGGEQSIYSSYPIISVKRLTTEFTMQDGATAVIGGLTQTVEDDVDSGIPYLRKIPWIGPKLFGWKSREKVQKEIIVCVTLGIANPSELPKDIGLPKNAIIGREYVSGSRKEPGDREGGAVKALQLDNRLLDDIRAE